MNGAANSNSSQAAGAAPGADSPTELRAQIDALKAQLALLDERRERMLKNKPSGRTRSATEVEQLIREKQQQMERSSLTIKEEKAALAEMKKMKNDVARAIEWESEFDELNNKRAAAKKEMADRYEALDAHRNTAFRTEAASTLGLAEAELIELKLTVTEELQELLSSPLWRKRLSAECSVVSRMDRGTKKGMTLAGAAGAVEAAKALIQSIGPVAVRRKALDEEQQGLLIGKKGATIAQLQEETGCSMDIRKGSSLVVIAGPQAAVEAAEVLIDELLHDQRRVEVILKFDPEQKGTLLGKSGSTIHRLQQQSNGAQLEIAKGDECSIRIWGPYAAVNRAHKDLVALLFLDAKKIEVVEVPGELLDVVIGPRGETVKKLEELHGVRIDSSRGPDRQSPSKLKFRGSVEGVKAAVAAVNAVIERERKVESVLQVESQHVGLLLGKSGATIGAIQKESGAVLDVQKRAGAASSSQTVTVRGNATSVAKALAALEAVLQYKAECNEEMIIDPRMMPLLIGRGGEIINAIRLETGAAIDGEREGTKGGGEGGGGAGPEDGGGGGGGESKNGKGGGKGGKGGGGGGGVSDAEKPRFKIRGSKEAVARAKELILEQIEANRFVSEGCVLPWHAIDALVGRNGAKLRELESTYNVQVILPGQDVASETVGLGSGLVSISTSMTLKGKRKAVHAARDFIATLSAQHEVHELELSSEDAALLSSVMLDDEEVLDTLGEANAVEMVYEPRRGVVRLRGEGAMEGRQKIRQLLAAERVAEESLVCPPAQFALLSEPSGGALIHLQQLCAPAMVALLESASNAVCVSAAARVLPDCVAIAQRWLSEHAAAEATVHVPPEVVGLVKQRLEQLANEWRVRLDFQPATAVELAAAGGSALGSSGGGSTPGGKGGADTRAGTLRLSGASKVVEDATRAATALVRAHAHLEERLVLSPAEYSLVQLLLTKSDAAAAPGGKGAGGKGAAAGPAAGKGAGRGGRGTGVAAAAGGELANGQAAAAEGLFAGVGARLVPKGSEGKPEGGLVLRGTAEPVQKCKAKVEALLIAAESAAASMALTQPQYDKLTARGGAVIRRLQEAHTCALTAQPEPLQLQLLGAPEAVARMRTALEPELDVDEHTRELPERMLGIVIGKSGSNIKRLQQESGASIEVERGTRRVIVRGTAAAVAKAIALLDALGVEQEVKVSQKQIPILIGRGGTTIKQLQADSGAVMDIRKEESLVRVRGTQEQVEDAVRRMQALLAEGGGGGGGGGGGAGAPPPGLKATNGPPPGLA